MDLLRVYKYLSTTFARIKQARPKSVLPEQVIKKPANILDLPPEVLLKIVEHLHENDSLCAGLSSKKLYDIHVKMFGLSTLASALRSVRPEDYVQRFDIICDFLGPEWVFCYARYKWVRIDSVSFLKTLGHAKLSNLC